MKNSTLLSLGSNLGDRKRNITDTLRSLEKISFLEKRSNIYLSKAMIPENSPEEWSKDFYNCVVLCRTDLSSQQLLIETQKIEKDLNTTSRNKGTSAPRMVDIDILTYNNETIMEKDLQIPHPRMAERNFVIYPLAEIFPEFEINGIKVLEIKNNLPEIKTI